MRNKENIYDIVQGKHAITSLLLTYKISNIELLSAVELLHHLSREAKKTAINLLFFE